MSSDPSGPLSWANLKTKLRAAYESIGDERSADLAKLVASCQQYHMCNSVYCPRCAHRSAKRRHKAASATLEKLRVLAQRARYVHVVANPGDVQIADLEQATWTMHKNIAEFTLEVAPKALGYVAQVEAPLSTKRDGHAYPHLHCLIALPQQAPELAAGTVANFWAAATALPVSNVNCVVKYALTPADVDYVAGYVLKRRKETDLSRLITDVRVFDQYQQQLRGVPRLADGGVFKGVAQGRLPEWVN